MASKGINKAIILGNLGQEPEVRYLTNGTAVANISIATSKSGKDKNTGEKKEKTEWHRVVAYGRLAEIIAEYLHKGAKVYIEGRLQTRKWQDKNNIERYTTEIQAHELQMLDNKNSNISNSWGQEKATNEQVSGISEVMEKPQDQALDNDWDDIPF